MTGRREPVVAIDGPAGAGKSTVARLLAERLGYTLVPTGAMYRAVALAITRDGVPAREGTELRRYLARLVLAVREGTVLLNGEDVRSEIRTEEVARATSYVTTLAAVRETVTPLQRQAAARGGVVLEGRDTGTVVCPDAEIKFFLTASLDARARRRHAELRAQGRDASVEALRDELRARDAQDTTRALAPLRRAPDAIELDTSELPVERVVARMLEVVEARRRAAGHPAGRAARRSRLYGAVRRVAAALMRALFGLEARGVEHVPAEGPVLFVANHASLLDPPAVGGCAPRQLYFLAKEQLFRIPLFGALIRAVNARPVKRGGADPVALRAALRVLEEGGALLIFPEGSRGPEGVLRPPRPGAAMLAVMTGAPVVPVYVRGTGRAWPTGRWLPRPAKVRVTFGPPLRFAAGRRGEERKQAYERASREMMAAIARLRDTVAAHGEARPQLSAAREQS